MYLHSRYKKFATGGSVITDDGGSTLVMKPPPGEPPAIEVPSDIPENAAPADQVAATIARARSFRNEPMPEMATPKYRNFDVPLRASDSIPDTIVGRYLSGTPQGQRPGRITLSAAQVEAAKIAGISVVQYAQQLIRLREEKINDPDRYGSGQ
jgi:hypothetical protein